MQTKKCTCKTCRRKGQELPLSDFGNNKKNPDGYQYWCKECQNQYQTGYNNKYREKKRKAKLIAQTPIVKTPYITPAPLSPLEKEYFTEHYKTTDLRIMSSKLGRSIDYLATLKAETERLEQIKLKAHNKLHSAGNDEEFNRIEQLLVKIHRAVHSIEQRTQLIEDKLINFGI